MCYRPSGRKRIRALLVSVCLLLALSAGGGKPHIPQGAGVGGVRFDAILELEAPIMRTRVMLFVRYWVAPDHYTLGVVWGEPHSGNLNFPVYPPSLVVQSTPQEFAISHDVHHTVDSTFRKPLGIRPPFSHVFGAYDPRDLRFAEPEALASRVSSEELRATDLTREAIPGAAINKDADQREAPRKTHDVRCTEVGANESRVELLDAGGKVIKKIDYKYEEKGNRDTIRRQEVELPLHPILAHVEGEGVTVEVNGERRAFHEFPVPHHAGGRKATVDYEMVQLGGETVSLPARITVRRGVDGLALRSARLVNFVRVSGDASECKRQAERFARLSDTDEKCRQLFLKYWLKELAAVSVSDRQTLQELRPRIEERPTESMTPGEHLKRINKLLETDWVLSDGASLKKHYEEYLSILASDKLDTMFLHAGYHPIETTMRWGLFRCADQMLAKWADACAKTQSVRAILDFSATALAHGELWSSGGLLTRAAAMTKEPNECFEAEALRCWAFKRVLIVAREGEQTGRNDLCVTQAAWALSTVGPEEIQEVADQSLAIAKRLYAGFGAPTKTQRMLMSQIERHATTQREAETGNAPP